MPDHPFLDWENHDSISSTRTGVILCSCGGNIRHQIDLVSLRYRVEDLPGIAFTTIEPYACSKDSLVRLRNAIIEKELDQVVVGGCAPRLIENLFQQGVRIEDQLACRIGIANIREGCANAHEGDPAGALEKAFDMIRMENARLVNLQPPECSNIAIERSALVVGDSSIGLSIAQELAKENIQVTLLGDVDTPAAGAGDDGQERHSSLSNVRFIRKATVTRVSGGPGDYHIQLNVNGKTEEIRAGAIILSNRPGYFGVHSAAAALAHYLRIPQDLNGYYIEPRLRLRPARYMDDGVYVFGAAHGSVDEGEEVYEGFLTAARALRFLNNRVSQLAIPSARVDDALCTGCGECTQVCPTSALTMKVRSSLLSVSEVQPLRCIGCGNCSVACPVKAISVQGWEEPSVLAQISSAWTAGRQTPASPKILVLACEWSAYAAADMAGVHHLAYPASARIVRLNCSAKFDTDYVLWAFLTGADGVMLGICPPGECHYGKGNWFARERFKELQTELIAHHVDPRRLRLETFSGEDGVGFANSIVDFAAALHKPARDLLQRAVRV